MRGEDQGLNLLLQSIRDVGLKVLSDRVKPNLEIIAVHGLGADPEYTWMFKPSAKAENAQRVHLLKDLLVHDFPNARILGFSYNSDWLVDAPHKTFHDIAVEFKKLLVATRSSLRLPIIFIGHSFGGIVIKEALLECQADSNEFSKNLVDDTCGLIFLGTPHHGSSLSNLATIASNLTGFLGSNDSLVLPLQYHNSQLRNLEQRFRDCRQEQSRLGKHIQAISFYETKPTFFAGINLGLVVDQISAIGNADGECPIDTDHSGLNKCRSKNDQLYKKLKGTIATLRSPSPLETADDWIRDHYSKQGRLQIERISGDLLNMSQCYINLVIVESAGAVDSASSPSHQSLEARLQIQTPDENLQVELSSLFNSRCGRDGKSRHPRRILIRGRAGVGKTTLCKKIVDEFIHAGMWADLFDLLLWVPLRRLKGKPDASYNFENLFYDEFFFNHADGRKLSALLWRELSPERTLFILDGLDEISQDLSRDSAMFRFLAELLDQPNVIITSRPSGTLPPSVHALDLEIETIGFYPHQVEEYLEKTIDDMEKVNEIKSFLQSHGLIQGLVRIPIQLDAFCFTWEGSNYQTMTQTMTGVYGAIEKRLWMKDIQRLQKKYEGELITEPDKLDSSNIEHIMKNEIEGLEFLAFTGLYNDVIEFTSRHRDALASDSRPMLLPGTLARLSFLRTSDPSSPHSSRSYHFLHLTFQEYFAARYFVRHWEKKEHLDCLTLSNGQEKKMEPRRFLGKHKYTGHYDVFWRALCYRLAQVR